MDLCVYLNMLGKMDKYPTVNNSLNILYIDETSCSLLESIGYVSGRINQKRSALDTDFGEGRDSSLSGFLVGLGTTDYIMSKTNDRATTHTIIIKYYRGYNFRDEVTLHLMNIPEGAPDGSGESGHLSSAEYLW